MQHTDPKSREHLAEARKTVGPAKWFGDSMPGITKMLYALERAHTRIDALCKKVERLSCKKK